MKLLRENCFQLADSLCLYSPDKKSLTNAAGYFVLSGRPIVEVIQHIISKHAEVCMYVCTYIRTYICTSMYQISICTYVCTHEYTYVVMLYIYIYIYIYIYNIYIYIISATGRIKDSIYYTTELFKSCSV